MARGDDPRFNPYAPPTGTLSRDDELGPIVIHAAFGGFWRRLSAWLLDALLIYVVTVVAVLALESLEGRRFDDPDDLEPLAVLACISYIYKAVMESSALQATLGKFAFGIKVTDIDGRRVSFARASGRFLAKTLSNITCGFGYLLIGWNDSKQGLHDMVAGTLVVRTR